MQYIIIGDRTLTLGKLIDTFVPFLGPGAERRETVGSTVFVGNYMSARETASPNTFEVTFYLPLEKIRRPLMRLLEGPEFEGGSQSL